MERERGELQFVTLSGQWHALHKREEGLKWAKGPSLCVPGKRTYKNTQAQIQVGVEVALVKCPSECFAFLGKIG